MIASVLWSSTGRRQWAALLDLLEPKLTLLADRELYDAVRAFAGPPDRLALDPHTVRLAQPRRGAQVKLLPGTALMASSQLPGHG